MRIDGLSLDFFRNYVHLDAAFDPNINVIYGDNAQGKTNLLEAVAYLSGVSHRARYDRELIQFGVDHAFLKGNVFARDREFLLEAELHRGARRVLRSNGVKLKNGGELSGIFQSVLFCPEDLYLITGFANSVASAAIEYQKEGQVFGIGVKIFTIAGPVRSEERRVGKECRSRWSPYH